MPHTNARPSSARILSSLITFFGLFGLLSLIALPSGLLNLVQPTAHAAAAFTVNSTGDGADSNTADNICNDGGGNCTLRAAIEQANATAGADTISFQIGSGVKTITLGSGLPTITDPLVIDGATQPGFAGTPVIELRGPGAGPGPVGFDALRITAGSSTVKGLAINRLNGTAIMIELQGNNLIVGNFIGADVTGATALPNSGFGVFIHNSANNTVGGTEAGARNVISGNLVGGVHIASGLSTGNRVQGNFIGTNAAGAAALPNATGVALASTGGGNLVGGTEAGARNVISGNSSNGVMISGSPTAAPDQPGDRVQGNFIGTNAAGAARLPNNQDGVRIESTRNHTVGGTEAGARNVISGNNQRGVNIISGATNNVVAGNFIGTNAAGSASVFNDGGGVRIESSNNLVGGADPAARNVISGNRSHGVEVAGGVANAVQGNYIGTDPSGAAALQNLSGGVSDRGAGTLIGGLTATPGTAPGNLISGNQTAITIVFDASQTLIRGNLIGTDATGTAKLIDQSFGVFGSGASTVVGGTEAGARNVISGFKVGVFGGGAIQGNYIGTDITGAVAIPNREFGIQTTAAAVVGGATPAARNVISGNAAGVWVTASSATIQGNHIGADANGAPLPNARHGVLLSLTAKNSVVGGAAQGAGNLIAFNGGSGIVAAPRVQILNDFTVNNSFRGNSIHSNALLGIDLVAPTTPAQNFLLEHDGPTPNDERDADAGPNGLQNSPAVTSVATSGGATNVSGTLSSKPDGAYAVDFYANTSCDPSGHGEGQTFVGSVQATTDASGNAAFSASFPAPASGQIITATATDAAGNTSEFSVCHEGAAPGAVQFTASSYEVSEGVATAAITVTRTLGSAAAATVDFATADGAATAGQDYTPAAGTLSFAAGETSKTFTVTIINDALDEGVETVNLTLSNPTGGINVGSQGTAVLSITDDDPLPTLSVGEFIELVAEGNSGTTELAFTVRLSAPSGTTVSVNYVAGGGSAVSGVDFQPASGTLTFAPGETSKRVVVLVNGDTLAESDEFFLLNLSAPVNAVFQNGQPGASATGVIWDDDSPGIHFSAPNYSVAERGGSINIGVVRRGDASAAASVFYSAFGSTTEPVSIFASHRHDFTQAGGRLDFAPGETEKSFTVLVNDDAYVEGSEIVFVNLLVSPDEPESLLSAKLTITSEDTGAPQPNPLDEDGFFVRQHYHDFLNREPDAEGLAFWTGVIASCGADAQCREVNRINVSGAFFLSIEFKETGYLIERLYKAAYGDATGASSLNGFHELQVPIVRLEEFLPDTQQISRGVIVNQGEWQAQIEANKQAFILEFVQRQRFIDAFPLSMTPTDFVDRLNGRAGGPLDASERQNLINELTANNTTAGRASVLRKVAEDPTLEEAEKNRAFVLMQYFGYLRRNPNDAPDHDYTGYEFWLNNLNRFNGNFVQAELVKAFISSIEYRQRFGQ